MRIVKINRATPAFYGWMVILITLIILGAYAWGIQLDQGLVVTGMRDIVIWGLYISNFIFFVGLSAGGLVIYASTYIFGVEEYEPLSRIAVLQAGVCVILAMAFILADLGRPDRVYKLLLSPNPTSMFVYDFAVLSLYLALCAIDFLVLITGKGGRLACMVMASISLPIAIGVHSITAWVFGLVKARPGWLTALLAPIFLSSAIVSGLALLILIANLTTSLTKIRFQPKLTSDIGKILAAVIPIDLFLLFTEILTTTWPYAAMPEHINRVMLVLTGPYSALLWTEIIVGGILPFLLLVHRNMRRITVVQYVASILVLMGVLIKRFVLLILGLGISPLGELGSYAPTLIELSIVLSFYAFMALLFTIAIRVLPLEVSVGKVRSI